MITQSLRPSDGKSKRLAQISHHFMSPSARIPSMKNTELQLSVWLTDNTKILQGQVLGPLARELNRQLERETPSSQFSFRPLEHPQPSNLRPSEPLLVPVEASLPGIRAAYVRIKQAEFRVRPAIGVIVYGGRDAFEARRYYRRLAVGCLRFLNQPIANLGWLPTETSATEEQLAAVAVRIRREHFFQGLSRTTNDHKNENSA